MKRVLLYTDGACSGNPGAGGWGAVLIFNGHTKEISGYNKDTTNNRMEIFAVIQGLKQLKESCEVEVYSDSAYVCSAFNSGWVDNWLKNNWRTADKKDVKNADLWKQLLFEVQKHRVRFIKVKGHADNEFNNRCDKLATDEIKRVKDEKSGTAE